MTNQILAKIQDLQMEDLKLHDIKMMDQMEVHETKRANVELTSQRLAP